MFRFLGLILLVLLALAGWGYANAVADPQLHRIRVTMQDWPKGAAPLRIALLSDIHMQGPDMPPSRVTRLVGQVNAQRPDLILIAGDIFGDRALSTRQYSDAELAAPLGKLLAPLGVYAVFGNHDHMRDTRAFGAALEAAGVRALSNEVARAGVLTLAGFDDALTGHADIGRVVRKAARLPGPVVALSHTAEIAPKLPARFALVLGGHTHCGQAWIPWRERFSLPGTGSYPCGAYLDRGRGVIVTGGLGASGVPLRFGAPPDWWLITLGPR